MIKIGLPRAMSYYYLYPFLKTLITELGGEVILSKPTTKATLDKMSVCPTDEPCLAVKLYFSHVKQLIDEDCEYIFIPRVISVEAGNFCCPKIIGIADMITNTFDIGERILAPRIDMNNKQQMVEDLQHMAKCLGFKKNKVVDIFDKSWNFQKNFSKFMVDNQLTTEEAYEILDGNSSIDHYKEYEEKNESMPAIGVIGHPYVLYEWVSHNLIQRFRQYGKVFTPEMVDKKQIQDQMKQIYEGEKLWNFEAQVLGSALYLMKNRLVDRLVLVGLFECGPESIVEAYIEEEADRLGIPLLKLSLDEQTGEAGLVTRIEAFMDTEIENSVEKFDVVNKPFHPQRVLLREKPIVGFPTMGQLDIVIDSILKECGVETMKPPALSRRSIELGKELAPEFVCLPLTATLGQMIEMLELGANSFLMVSGKGRCRLGWYAQIQELLLKRKGIPFNMMIVDSPFPLRKNGLNFFNTIKHVTNGARFDKVIKSLALGYHKLEMLENAEAICRRIRAYESQRGQIDQVFNLLRTGIDQVSDYRAVTKLYKNFIEESETIKLENIDPLRVALVGEIWVLLEPFVNMEIEKFLGSRENIRVIVERELTVSHWLQGNVLHTKKAIKRAKEIQKAAAPYLTEYVGGHGRESVGLTGLASQEGVDGVVHLMPFTCMPEIVAHNILTQASDKLDIPVLSFIISDQTGEAGFETRVEAFLELLLERKFEKTYPMGWL